MFEVWRNCCTIQIHLLMPHNVDNCLPIYDFLPAVRYNHQNGDICFFNGVKIHLNNHSMIKIFKSIIYMLIEKDLNLSLLFWIT